MKTVKHEIKLERSVKIILGVFALGILLVLIIMLKAMFYNTNFICDNKIIPMLSQIDDHLIDVKLNTEEIEKNTVAIYRK